MEGMEPLRGRVNYLVGQDRSRWRTGIPTYARIRRPEVYPGIDLVYYGHNGAVEEDFVVRPGARPGAIPLAYQGARSARIDGRGDLLLETPAGEVRQRKPFVYQEVGGRRHEVAGRYVLAETPGSRRASNADARGGTVAFAVGPYDRKTALIIDPVIEPPVLQYGTYLGASGQGTAPAAIAVDGSGAAYVAGNTDTPGFPTTPGAYEPSATVSSAFVAKLAPDGASLIYSTYLGGGGVSGIAVDPAGAAYMCGGVSDTGPDAPISPGAFQTERGPYGAAWIAKLSPDGSALEYGTYLSGSRGDTRPNAIAVDSDGHAYVVGRTYEFDFPTTPGSLQRSMPREGVANAGFITKLSPNGGSLVYSTILGEESVSAKVDAVALDASQAVYVTGYAWSGFPVTQGSFQPFTRHGVGPSAFVSKIAADGGSLAFSTFLGGSHGNYNSDMFPVDEGLGVAVPPSGDSVFVVGQTPAVDFPTTPGAFQRRVRIRKFYTAAFAARLSGDGSRLLYSTYLQGFYNQGTYANLDVAWFVALDPSGTAASVTGTTTSAVFPVSADAIEKTRPSNGTFLTQIAEGGDRLLYSTYMPTAFGLRLISFTAALASDGRGGVYFAAPARQGFPVTPGALQTHNNAGKHGNAAVARLLLQPSYAVSGQITQKSAGLAGVTVTAGAASAVTDSNGNYRLADLPAGKWQTVTPHAEGLVFHPPSVRVLAHQDVTGADFRAEAPPHH